MDKKNNLLYGDIAGLLDTGGDMMQFINHFMNILIFRKCRSVRFLVPLTLDEINDARGAAVRQHFTSIQSLCNRGPSQLMDSILPILTKVKPNEHEFDLELTRKVIAEQLMEEVAIQKREAESHMNSGDDEDQIEFEGQVSLESAMEQYFVSLENFYKTIAEKMILFDPLDRKIPVEGDADQTTKQKEVVQRITALKGVLASVIENQLTYAKQRKLKDIQLDAKYQIIDLAEKMSQQAKIQGEAFNKDFKQEKLYKVTHLAFQFFADHKLVSNAQEMLDDFLSFSNQQEQLISKSKQYKDMSGND